MNNKLDELLDVAYSHKYARSFITEETDLFIEALTLNLWSEVVEEMKWRVVIEWRKLSKRDAKRILLASFSHAESSKKWEKANPGMYDKARKFSLWNELLESRDWTTTVHWADMTKEEAKQAVLNEAQKHEYPILFQTQANRYYVKAIELGILEETQSRMKDTKEFTIKHLTVKDAIKILKKLDKDSSVHLGMKRELFYLWHNTST